MKGVCLKSMRGRVAILIAITMLLLPLIACSHIIKNGNDTVASIYMDATVSAKCEFSHAINHNIGTFSHYQPIEDAEEWLIDMRDDFSMIYSPSTQFFRKYLLDVCYERNGRVGSLVTFYGYSTCIIPYCEVCLRPNIYGSGSENGLFSIIEDVDGRLTIQPKYHDGWPGLISNTTDMLEEDSIIEVFMSDGNFVDLMSNTGILSRMPEVQEDGFRVWPSMIYDSRESMSIHYHERAESTLWEWLMNPDNAYRIFVHNPYPEILMAVPVREITNGMWERWRIQAFILAGDVTLVGRHGTISQIPEFHEDEFYFNLVTDGNFEMQYIMHHEQESSQLWQLLKRDFQ